jgi:hypothetical protein
MEQAEQVQVQAHQSQVHESVEQAQAHELVQQAPVQAPEIKLPYRTVLKDKFNKLYADGIKKTFILLPLEIQTEFEKLTMNLMQEDYIARGLLLDAINCFYRKFFRLCDASYLWTNFSDNAWNYRPHQS